MNRLAVVGTIIVVMLCGCEFDTSITATHAALRAEVRKQVIGAAEYGYKCALAGVPLDQVVADIEAIYSDWR